MKRALLKAPRDLVFEDLELQPADLDDDQLYVETEFSAVSTGTETAAYEGAPPLRAAVVNYPRLVGYCNCGRILRVGRGVQGFAVGDRVLTHQSHQSAFIGKPEDILATLTEAVPSEVGSMMYFAQLGLAALQKADYRAGENVVVIGLGVIGLATVGLARVLGARVIAVGNDRSRLEMARQQGADLCLSSDDENLLAQIESATGGVGVDLVITTANTWSSWKLALQIARYAGRIAVLGFPGRTEGPPPFNPLDSASFYDKQLSILACGQVSTSRLPPGEIRFTLQRNLALIMRFIEEGRLRLDKLITHRVAWQDLRSIYEMAALRDKELVGAVLDWTKAQGAPV